MAVPTHFRNEVLRLLGYEPPGFGTVPPTGFGDSATRSHSTLCATSPILGISPSDRIKITLPAASGFDKFYGNVQNLPMDEIHYDETGRAKWSRAESGIITQWIYDKDRDLVVRCVEDVQTDGVCGVPAGWKTLPGKGESIVTEYEYDERGRLVRSTTTGISL